MHRPQVFPDFIVRAIERPEFRLVAEVKSGSFDREDVTRRLRRYMEANACPLGLLVTPQKTHVYQDTWSKPPDSIRELAVVDTHELLGARRSLENERELVEAVREWLEAMCRAPGVPRHHTGEIAQLETHLAPALVEAELLRVGFR